MPCRVSDLSFDIGAGRRRGLHCLLPGVSPAVGGINTQPVVWISLPGVEGGWGGGGTERENEREKEKESNPSLDSSNQKEETDLGLSG